MDTIIDIIRRNPESRVVWRRQEIGAAGWVGRCRDSSCWIGNYRGEMKSIIDHYQQLAKTWDEMLIWIES